MKLKQLSVVLMLVLSNLVYANVYCSGVPVKIQSSNTPNYHSFNELGATGSTLFISVPASKCRVTDGDSLKSRIYLLLDDIENSNGLNQLWVSMLLSAEARGSNINFSAYDLGENSDAIQALDPYYLAIE